MPQASYPSPLPASDFRVVNFRQDQQCLSDDHRADEILFQPITPMQVFLKNSSILFGHISKLFEVAAVILLAVIYIIRANPSILITRR